MKKMRKRALVLMAGLAMALFGVAMLNTHDTHALADEGQVGSGKKCSHTLCYNKASGAVWIYYQYSGGTGTLRAPSGGQGNVVSATCRQYGGFVVLARLLYSKDGGDTSKPFRGTQIRNVVAGNFVGTGPQRGIQYRDDKAGSISDSVGDATAMRAFTFSEARAAYYSMPPEARRNDAGVEYPWSESSELGVFCYGEGKADDGFHSMSGVTVLGNSSVPVIDGTSTLPVVNAEPGTNIEIVFKHYIAIMEVTYNPQVCTNPSQYTGISNSVGSFGPPGQACASESWTHPGNEPGDQGTFWTTKVVENKFPTTVPSSKKMYCQAITYNPQTFSFTASLTEGTGPVYSDGSAYSAACVTIKPGETELDSGCDEDSKYVSNVRIGNSTAQSGVVNFNYYSKNVGGSPGDWHYTGWGTSGDKAFDGNKTGDGSGKNTQIVYGKPFDNVAFVHTYCYGAQKVRLLNRGDSGKSPDLLSSQYSVSTSPNFGRHSSSLAGRTFGGEDDLIKGFGDMAPLIDESHTKDRTAWGVDAVWDDGYGFSIQDPDPENESTGYGDKKGAYGIQTGDVGHKLVQTLSWTNTRAWQQWGYEYDESKCGCDQDAEGINYDYSEANTGGFETAYDHYLAGIDYGRIIKIGATYDSWTSRCYEDGCCCDECTCTKYKESGLEYPDAIYSDRGDNPDKTVAVWVPYNFTTTATSSINQSEILYPGEKVTANLKVTIDPRENALTSDGVYATKTPTTSVHIFQFLVKKGASESDMADILAESVDGMTTGTSGCQGNRYRGNANVVDCLDENGTKLDNLGDETIYNPASDVGGKVAFQREGSAYSRTVPDVEAGTKYCIVVGISIGDSHGYFSDGGYGDLTDASASAPNFGANGNSMGNGGGYWHLSGASCRTIAKKPSVQIWNGSIYSRENVYSSTAIKKVAQWKLSGKDWNENEARLFGSWAEYLTVAGDGASVSGTNNEFSKGGFSSGAALGYGLGNLRLAGKTENEPSGKITDSDTDAKYSGHNTINYDYCKFSRLTIANSKCLEAVGNSSNGNNIVGNSDIGYSLSDYTSKLESRYIDLGIEQKDKNWNLSDPSSYTELQTTTATADLADAARTHLVNLSEDSEINTPFTVTEGTWVINAKGHTLTISSNICYGAGTCNNVNDELVLSARNNSTYKEENATGLGDDVPDSEKIQAASITGIPQILIFADEIKIESNVTQIDAWLIAETKIDTCSEVTHSAYDTSKCNRTLKVNGPVFAPYLELARTAGAWPGWDGGDRKGYDGDHSSVDLGTAALNRDLARDGSVTPAEIFDLRADVLLWSYSQAERYEQAVVVYSSELAPRY